ncbi:N-acetyltransferase [Phytohabitans aurantiacus]|uniref:N-acetyltransferase n=1 Tax=Phytohabitans aurantiacus TaxID=3016789 RepID=A0ABQ5QZE7_9ACTN|nr:N-acetyltransferase [Phytohabitans aurantiacus]
MLVETSVATPDAYWLIPDRGERKAVFGRYWQALVDPVLSGRVDGWFVDVTDPVDAVAVWQDHTPSQTAQSNVDDELLNAAYGRHADRFRLREAVLAHHRPSQPHRGLVWMGVRPDRQRQGLGSALLRHALRSMDTDSDGAATYLVAVCSPAREFFMRHGYQLHQPAPLFLPDSGPALWPLWRDPMPADHRSPPPKH